MYFFTHLFMAKTLYQYFGEEGKLDKHAFLYGNIKPDLPSPSRNHHTLDNHLTTVCDKANILIEDEVSLKVFSEMIGEVCHYACDFCCYYHMNEEVHNRRLHHFTYELKLHWKLLREGYKLIPSRKLPRKDINSIILEMRNDYLAETRSMQRDIDFAFASAVWICESILYYKKYATEMENEVQRALCYSLLEEGSL